MVVGGGRTGCLRSPTGARGQGAGGPRRRKRTCPPTPPTGLGRGRGGGRQLPWRAAPLALSATSAPAPPPHRHGRAHRLPTRMDAAAQWQRECAGRGVGGRGNGRGGSSRVAAGQAGRVRSGVAATWGGRATPGEGGSGLCWRRRHRRHRSSAVGSSVLATLGRSAGHTRKESLGEKGRGGRAHERRPRGAPKRIASSAAVGCAGGRSDAIPRRRAGL